MNGSKRDFQNGQWLMMLAQKGGFQKTMKLSDRIPISFLILNVLSREFHKIKLWMKTCERNKSIKKILAGSFGYKF